MKISFKKCVCGKSEISVKAIHCPECGKKLSSEIYDSINKQEQVKDRTQEAIHETLGFIGKTLKKTFAFYKKLPSLYQKCVLIIVIFLFSNKFPFGILGEFGSYIQAGLILGAIFLIIQVFQQIDKKGVFDKK